MKNITFLKEKIGGTMIEHKYSRYDKDTGKFVEIPKIDDLCFILKRKFVDLQEQITYLEEENEKIKSEKYASEELVKMKKKLNEMEEAYYSGFPISKKERESIREWQINHDAEKHNAQTSRERLRLDGVSGGRYSYIFIPTSIGIIGKIKCSICGDEFCFRDL